MLEIGGIFFRHRACGRRSTIFAPDRIRRRIAVARSIAADGEKNNDHERKPQKSANLAT
jgi:hypothetical protein